MCTGGYFLFAHYLPQKQRLSHFPFISHHMRLRLFSFRKALSQNKQLLEKTKKPPFVTIRSVICACSHATLCSYSVQLWPYFPANALLQKEHLKQVSVAPCGFGFTINLIHIFCDVWLNTPKVAMIRISMLSGFTSNCVAPDLETICYRLYIINLPTQNYK
jgi:hypothetical protein